MFKRSPYVFVFLLLIGPIEAEPQSRESIDIADLIQGYSELHDQKFVLDPRVSAKVSMIGIEIADIDYAILTKIFKVHGYDAIEADGVVYVIPTSVADSIRPFLETE